MVPAGHGPFRRRRTGARVVRPERFDARPPPVEIAERAAVNSGKPPWSASLTGAECHCAAAFENR